MTTHLHTAADALRRALEAHWPEHQFAVNVGQVDRDDPSGSGGRLLKLVGLGTDRVVVIGAVRCGGDCVVPVGGLPAKLYVRRLGSRATRGLA